MRDLKPLNFQKWIDDHRHLLKPPVCNKLVFEDAEFIVMVVGGPNSRKDYHYDEGEEFFYQVEGHMVLKVMENKRPRDIQINQGEIFLLPSLFRTAYSFDYQRSNKNDQKPAEGRFRCF